MATRQVRRLYDDALAAHARGDRKAAAQLAEEALALDPADQLAAQLHHLRARVLIWDGAPLRGYELLLTEGAAVESIDPGLAAGMFADAALAALTGGETDAAVRVSRRGLELARRFAPELEPTLELSSQIVETFTEDARVATEALVTRFADMGRNELLASWEPLMRCASVLFWVEDYERARGLLEHVLDRARGFGLRAILPVGLDTLAAIDFRVGRWAAADARSTEALRVARALDQSPQVASCLTTLAGIAAARGDRPACEEYAHEALRLRESYVFVGPWARTALASLALSEGKADEAIAEIERVVDDASPLDPAISAWPRELVEAYVRADRIAEAQEVVTALAARVHAAPRPGLRALVEHCRALVAPVKRFERHFEEALVWHSRTSTPFFRARTELLYGMRLRRARRATDAKVHLQLALAAFDRLGAQTWAEQARAELATGRRAATGPGALREVLSPHELEVALLVGRGATNKEAAAALFVSPKTIDYHLSSIYRKLEVRSRTELAAFIARGS